jgi:predicted O-methyltransferase YrrM
MAFMNEYKFTSAWFETAKHVWEEIIPQLSPKIILEIGSYEGASTCYLIDKLAGESAMEIHCIDTWEGGMEHQGTDMSSVEARYDHNVALAIARAKNKVTIVKHKKNSDIALATLISEGKKNYFDFIYVDGSHQAPDVLCDAVLGFRLLKVGGAMVFDDYLWSENLPYGKDPLRCPKPAIDAFVNLHFRKLNIISAPLYQLYLQKISD